MADSPVAANEREHAFFNNVRKTGLVYALNNGIGWFHWSAGNDHCFPVWSDEATANICALVQNSTYKPKPIQLTEFLNDFLPALAKQDLWISLNPLSDMCGNERPAAAVAQVLNE